MNRKPLFKALLIGIAAGVAIGALALWLGLWGAPPNTDPTPEDIARAETLRPSDPHLAEIYDRACVTCHASVDAQAPLAGHRVAWQVRLDARGMGGLLSSARNGLGAMPAMGLCPDCSDDDLHGLILFMSQTGEQ